MNDDIELSAYMDKCPICKGDIGATAAAVDTSTHMPKYNCIVCGRDICEKCIGLIYGSTSVCGGCVRAAEERIMQM